MNKKSSGSNNENKNCDLARSASRSEALEKFDQQSASSDIDCSGELFSDDEGLDQRFRTPKMAVRTIINDFFESPVNGEIDNKTFIEDAEFLIDRSPNCLLNQTRTPMGKASVPKTPVNLAPFIRKTDISWTSEMETPKAKSIYGSTGIHENLDLISKRLRSPSPNIGNLEDDVTESTSPVLCKKKKKPKRKVQKRSLRLSPTHLNNAQSSYSSASSSSTFDQTGLIRNQHGSKNSPSIDTVSNKPNGNIKDSQGTDVSDKKHNTSTEEFFSNSSFSCLDRIFNEQIANEVKDNEKNVAENQDDLIDTDVLDKVAHIRRNQKPIKRVSDVKHTIVPNEAFSKPVIELELADIGSQKYKSLRESVGKHSSLPYLSDTNKIIEKSIGKINNSENLKNLETKENKLEKRKSLHSNELDNIKSWKSNEPGFSSANGKTIAINQKYMDKAMKIFKEVENGVTDEDPNKENCNRFVDKAGYSKNSSIKFDDNTFSNASGKAITIGNEFMKKALKIFHDVDNQSHTNEKSLKVEKNVSIKRNIDVKSPNNFDSDGSESANGKSIHIDNWHLEKAMETFSNIENDFSNRKNYQNINKDRLKNPNRLKAPILEYKSNLKTDCHSQNHELNINLPQDSNGFATASGKNIGIDANKINHYEEIYKKIDTNDSNISKTTTSSRISTRKNNAESENNQINGFSGGFSITTGKPINVNDMKMNKYQEIYNQIEIDPSTSHNNFAKLHSNNDFIQDQIVNTGENISDIIPVQPMIVEDCVYNNLTEIIEKTANPVHISNKNLINREMHSDIANSHQDNNIHQNMIDNIFDNLNNYREDKINNTNGDLLDQVSMNTNKNINSKSPQSNLEQVPTEESRIINEFSTLNRINELPFIEQNLIDDNSFNKLINENNNDIVIKNANPVDLQMFNENTDLNDYFSLLETNAYPNNFMDPEEINFAEFFQENILPIDDQIKDQVDKQRGEIIQTNPKNLLEEFELSEFLVEKVNEFQETGMVTHARFLDVPTGISNEDLEQQQMIKNENTDVQLQNYIDSKKDNYGEIITNVSTIGITNSLKNDGFSTAGGKKIKIDEISMKKGFELYNEIETINDESNLLKKNDTYKKQSIQENCTNSPKIFVEDKQKLSEYKNNFLEKCQYANKGKPLNYKPKNVDHQNHAIESLTLNSMSASQCFDSLTDSIISKLEYVDNGIPKNSEDEKVSNDSEIGHLSPGLFKDSLRFDSDLRSNNKVLENQRALEIKINSNETISFINNSSSNVTVKLMFNDNSNLPQEMNLDITNQMLHLENGLSINFQNASQSLQQMSTKLNDRSESDSCNASNLLGVQVKKQADKRKYSECESSTPINLPKKRRTGCAFEGKKLFSDESDSEVDESNQQSPVMEKNQEEVPVVENMSIQNFNQELQYKTDFSEYHRQSLIFEQEKIIREKHHSPVNPIIGSLLHKKLINSEKTISWGKLVDDAMPSPCSYEEIEKRQLDPKIIDITLSNALEYKFDMNKTNNGHEKTFIFHLSENAKLITDENACAGINEFKRAFLAMPGVSSKLFPDGWIENHYRLIVWKLASIDRIKFNSTELPIMLTPDQVIKQLKYRYDREIDRVQRPALRRIVEKDDVSSRRMVLCVASIKQDDKKADIDDSVKRFLGVSQWKITVTDGWYILPVTIDSPMNNYIASGKIKEGTKFVTCGAELLECERGCHPLEVPANVSLRMHTNSTRRARWDAKLGYQKDPRPIPIKLKHVTDHGGLIGELTVVAARIYPIVYQEKTANKEFVIRNARAEEKVASDFEYQRQLKADAICTEVEHNFNKSRKSYSESNSMTQDSYNGRKCYDWTKQREECQQLIAERVQNELPPPREVTPMLKIRIADGECSAILTIYGANEDFNYDIKEGTTLIINNLVYCGKRAGELNLKTTRITQFRIENLLKMDYPLRECTLIPDINVLTFDPKFHEFDTVGIVISSGPAPFGMKNFECVNLVYPKDEEEASFLTILFWKGIDAFGYQKALQVGFYVACTNLQWRRNTQWHLPVAYCTENTIFTNNPKQMHLAKTLETLKVKIDDPEDFAEKCAPIISIELTRKPGRASQGTPAGRDSTRSSSSNFSTPNVSGESPFDRNISGNAIRKRLEMLNTYGTPSDFSPVVLKNSSTRVNKNYTPILPCRSKEM